MEFTNIHVERIRWDAGAKKIKSSYGGSGKILFQTPRLHATVTSMPKFPGAVSLSIDPSTIPQSFRDFLETLETSACTALPTTLDPDSCIPAFEKLAMFNDALAFDADAMLIGDVTQCTGRWVVSLLVQLDGAWVGQSSWGTRFKVVQLKFHEKLEESVPPVSSGTKRDYAFFISGRPYLFLSDE